MDTERAPRPAVPGGAAAIAGLLACGAGLILLCTGSFGALVNLELRNRGRGLERKLAEVRARAAEDADAQALLALLAERLQGEHRVRREFPPALPEAPPEDPWGTTVRYERRGPDAAWLTSAGRDREFGTSDDLARELRTR